ncbi:hypothetical protein BJ138DRAFT_937966, partial [Hygrophoropsis aurantiaca]
MTEDGYGSTVIEEETSLDADAPDGTEDATSDSDTDINTYEPSSVTPLDGNLEESINTLINSLVDCTVGSTEPDPDSGSILEPGSNSLSGSGPSTRSPNVPRSRRVGIVCPPRNYKRPPSLHNLQERPQPAATQLPSSPSPDSDAPKQSPPIPPRSPLRPRSSRASSSSVTIHRESQSSFVPGPTGVNPSEESGVPEYMPETQTASLPLEEMPLLHRASFGSLSALLESLGADYDPHTSRNSTRSDFP